MKRIKKLLNDINIAFKDAFHKNNQNIQGDESDINLENYNTLTAKIIDDASMQEYFTALRYAISRKDVKNIAITGPYGAGKSTVIYSYLQKQYKGKFINVSLASFEMPESKTKEANYQQVELSILQQILYKENSDVLPDSRIDRILNRNSRHIKRIFISVIKFLLPAGMAVSLILYKKISELFSIPPDFGALLAKFYYLNIGAVFILSLISLYYIADAASRAGFFDKKIKLSKIAFLSGEVEGAQVEKSSLLNNCLDEIVYFFSRLSEYRVVVFEDLDRLKNPEIFIKLREINKIVNNNLDEHDTLRFVYSVRDDVFSEPESRIKFFDFILPVIPYMDNKNAYSLLNDKMGSLITDGRQCLKYTALFIRDMRCLQNIANEYQVFINNAGHQNVPIKQYAMIFYKNTFSHDYSLVDRNLGVLYSLIENYINKTLHYDHFNYLEVEEQELLEEIKSINAEKAAFPEDIRNEIIDRFIPETVSVHLSFAKMSNSGYGQNITQYSTESLRADEKSFLELLNFSNTIVIGQKANITNYNNEITATERKELLNEYTKRKKTIGEEKNKKYIALQASLRNAREKIRKKNAIPLSELVRSIGREQFGVIAEKYIKEACEHVQTGKEQRQALENEMLYGGIDALYFLVSESYIDQDFMRYRSIFQEGGISSHDNRYIRNVAQDISAAEANELGNLDSVELVIEELRDLNLIFRPGAFHYQVISHLLEKKSPVLQEMISILFGLSGKQILSVFDEIRKHVTSPETFKNFLRISMEINGYLGHMLDILDEADDNDSRTGILTEILASVSPVETEDEDRLRQFIEAEGSRIISSLQERQVPGFLKTLAELDVKFSELFIPLTSIESECISYIGRESLYALNSHNVGVALFALLNKDNVSIKDGQSYPWTLARESVPEMMNYFRQHPDAFVLHVFSQSDEKGDAVREVLLLCGLSDDVKVNIIREMPFTLSSLAGIPDEPQTTHEGREISLHDLFYLCDRIEPDWASLMDYICELCDMDILTGYLSRHADALSSGGPGVVDGDKYDLLHMKVVCNDGLDEHTYLKLISNIEINEHHLDARISATNLKRLIDNKKIALSTDNFKHVSELPVINFDKDISLFISWFSLFSDEFLINSARYILRGVDDRVTGLLLSEIMNSELFSLFTKQALASECETYYAALPLSDLDMPEDVKIELLKVTDNPELKDNLFRSLILGGLKGKEELRKCSRLTSEPGMEKIFNQLTEATFDAVDPVRMAAFLTLLSDAGLIQEPEPRDNGKFHVKIPRRSVLPTGID
ncbi:MULTISPECIES: hypothetical protein [Pantoea]|uniref:DNA-binding protein n=1 Tax=Pantoea brenneri TaxID=472694 RepID=A0ABU9MTM1_9GAMM|nr:hypothetical protein [Pantoea sp. 3.5.1]